MNRVLTIVCCATLVVCGCTLLSVVNGCASSGSFTNRQIIRVMTYNIHHGIGPDDRLDIKRVADIIRRSEADVVALQDVDRGVARTEGIDLMTKLADLTGMTYTFVKSRNLDGGEHGNGLLTHFPILEEKSELYRLQTAKNECSLMRLVLDVHGTEIFLMNTELAGNAADSVQVSNVSEVIDAAKEIVNVPVIFCGSLPSSSDSSSLKPIGDTFSDCWTISGFGNGATFPATSPDRRLDYIFVSKSRVPTDSKSPEVSLRPVKAEVLADSASDHRPLVVTLNIVSQ